MRIEVSPHEQYPAPSPRKGAGTRQVGQWQQRQAFYRQVWRRRSLQSWALPVTLVLLGAVIAAVSGHFVVDHPKEVLGALIALPFLFVAIKRLEFGFLLMAALATAFGPQLLSLKSLAIYPAEALLLCLLLALVVQVVFHARRMSWPSLTLTWPLLALFFLAILSTVVIQVSWLPEVPRTLNHNPIVLDELLGIGIFLVPLLVLLVTAECLRGKERWIDYTLHTFVALALLACLITIVDFRRLGGNVYTFRFNEGAIGWMSLRAIAQLLCLGGMIAYARLLLVKRWSRRLLYAIVLLLCLTSLYITLQNSWWLEVAIALLIITLAYSRRLFLALSGASLVMLFLLQGVLQKLQSVKADDLYRITIWQDFLRVWSKRPWLGVGPGNAWNYDQVFTQLPPLIRDFNKTGLGIAHNGYLQMLAELGPLGLLLLLAAIALIVVASIQLYRRASREKRHDDRVLALVSLGLICGSAVADVVSGSLLLPPRQLGAFNELPLMLTSWIVFSCAIHQLSRYRARGREPW